MNLMKGSVNNMAYKKPTEEIKQKKLENRLNYFFIEYSKENECYVLTDDFRLEVLYLKISDDKNSFNACDGAPLVGVLRNAVKEFLIREGLLVRS